MVITTAVDVSIFQHIPHNVMLCESGDNELLVLENQQSTYFHQLLQAFHEDINNWKYNKIFCNSISTTYKHNNNVVSAMSEWQTLNSHNFLGGYLCCKQFEILNIITHPAPTVGESTPINVNFF